MSTRSIVTVAGAVVGAYFGYPQLGLMLGALVGGAVDPATIRGPEINEVTVQTQAEGVPRIIPWGTVMCVGNIIQNGPLIKTTEYESQGKGGASVETPTAYRTFAIGICEGPISGILRVWEDNTLVYDTRPGSLMAAESEKWMANKFLRLGGEDQGPDPFLTFIDSETPAYRGTAYMTFVLEDQTDRGGSFKQYRFEVAKELNTEVLESIPSTAEGSLGASNGSISGPTTPGQGGGGTFAEGQVNSYGGTLGSGGVLPNGNVYLAKWRFQGRAVGMRVTAWLKINGAVVWSTGVSIGDGEYVLLTAQLNFVPDASTVCAIGFDTEFASQGYFMLNVNQLATGGGPYDPYVPDGRDPPLIYESDDPSFGVIQDGSGNLYSAGALVQIGPIITPWGPSTIEVNEGLPTTVAAVMHEIHERCGVTNDLYDVSELTDEVDGFSVSGPYTGADAVNALRTVYMFDKSDHDGKLWYPKRGKPVVKTLTIDNLTEVPDTSQREQLSEIPYKVNLAYQHANSGYAIVKATAPSTPTPDRKTTGEVSMQTAVVFDENRAAQVADKIYKITLAESNGTTTLSVPLADAADLADADCIGLSLRGRTRRLRIEESAFSDWVVKFTLKSDRQSAYTSNVTGIPIPLPTLPPSTIVGDTELAILDIPARTDTEDDLNYLAAVSGALPPWYGAILQRSLDAGATYTTVQQINSAAVMGVLVDDVAEASEHYTDTTNAVQIQLYRSSQTLDNLTDAQFLSEQGAFALENDDGTWEVMQYRDAEAEMDGTITLTTLHRGLLNTGGSAHTAGARFVLLATAVHVPASAAWLGLNLTHRAISLSESADDTDNEETITFTGQSQVEYPVAYLDVSRDGSDVLTGTWLPRPRFGSDVNPIQSSNFLGYRVTLDDGVSPVTFDVPSASFTYDASAMGPSVEVSVSAINRITGPGPATSTNA